jgi:hypothetical protein
MKDICINRNDFLFFAQVWICIRQTSHCKIIGNYFIANLKFLISKEATRIHSYTVPCDKLFQKDKYRLFVTNCYELVVINLFEQLVASLLASSTLLQDDNNLFQTFQYAKYLCCV